MNVCFMMLLLVLCRRKFRQFLSLTRLRGRPESMKRTNGSCRYRDRDNPLSGRMLTKQRAAAACVATAHRLDDPVEKLDLPGAWGRSRRALRPLCPAAAWFIMALAGIFAVRAGRA
jgi:hypothetical protein